VKLGPSPYCTLVQMAGENPNQGNLRREDHLVNPFLRDQSLNLTGHLFHGECRVVT
jgi:hypothetical protein